MIRFKRCEIDYWDYLKLIQSINPTDYYHNTENQSVNNTYGISYVRIRDSGNNIIYNITDESKFALLMLKYPEYIRNVSYE